MNYRQTKKMFKKECPNIEIKSKESVYNAKKLWPFIIMIRKIDTNNTLSKTRRNDE